MIAINFKLLRNKMLTERFKDAFNFAFQLHKDQYRKSSKIPYISHLMEVCSICLASGATEDEAISALLHDSLEDQASNFGGTHKLKDEIKKRFGQNVLEIIEGCTEIGSDMSPKLSKLPWKQRKEMYLAHIALTNESVQLVAMADKLHNISSILFDFTEEKEKVWEKFNASKGESLWFYKSFINIFRDKNKNEELSLRLRKLFTKLNSAVLDLERI